MFGFNTPPVPGSHAGHRKDGSDGAIAKNETVSPTQHGAYSTHYTTPFHNSNTASKYVYPGRPRIRSPDYTRLLPDWDTTKVVPRPLDSFIRRLQRGPLEITIHVRINMKAVQNIYRYFKSTFSGETTESWAKHLDSLESEVFEREDFYPKQCYYCLLYTSPSPRD